MEVPHVEPTSDEEKTLAFTRLLTISQQLTDVALGKRLLTNAQLTDLANTACAELKKLELYDRLEYIEHILMHQTAMFAKYGGMLHELQREARADAGLASSESPTEPDAAHSAR